jgi:DNA-binding winged helix-turn-helix (wHTH) protein/ubiquinone/menaquinone biosynthesis C-methylase UbiE
MPDKRATSQFVRFGEFTLDLQSGELSKKGSQFLLPVQPFRILALLVRSPGTLVTRDDLRRALWPDDVFVDFEHSLNAAIKRLRQVLGDPAATPRFIETLPRRGYRFLAPVEARSSTSAAEAPVNAPYGLLARYYDVLCGYAAPINRHVRGRILRTVLPTVKSVCDVGCGSGETALELAGRGLEVHAVDSSPVFCDGVRARARRAKVKVLVYCDDMRNFRLPRPVDLVLAEFASLNNLADRRDLPRVFNAVARALPDRGWFCFDVNTPLSLRTQYPQTFWLEEKRFKLVQHGSLEADGRRARVDFEWLVPSGRLLRHVRETLWHVCWTDAEIRRALRVAGFDLIRSFDGLDVRPRTPGEKRGTDAYYLARKRKAGRTVDGHAATTKL